MSLQTVARKNTVYTMFHVYSVGCELQKPCNIHVWVCHWVSLTDTDTDSVTLLTILKQRQWQILLLFVKAKLTLLYVLLSIQTVVIICAKETQGNINFCDCPGVVKLTQNSQVFFLLSDLIIWDYLLFHHFVLRQPFLAVLNKKTSFAHFPSK